MDKILAFLKARLREKSTWAAALTVVFGILGAKLAPDQQENIRNAVYAVLTAIGVFVVEGQKPEA